MKNDFLIVNNLKSNLLVHDIAQYLDKINKIENENLVICPTSIYIPYFLKHSYKVGLQNISYHSDSYTGEITPLQASKMKIDYVLIGHSDQRMYFGEDDIDINKKIIESLKCGLKVILCIGETNEEKDLLKTSVVLKKQLKYALNNVSNLDNVYVGYEPIWAIGTNNIPSTKDLEKTISYIKTVVSKEFNYDNIKVLYGGSVNKENINLIKKIKSLNGIILGSAACDINEFLELYKELTN